MSVDHFSFTRFNLGQLAFDSEKDAGVIHQLSDAGDAVVRDHEFEIVGRETRAGRFQMRCRNARRQHDEKIDRQIFARFKHVTDSIHAEHVGVFVGIDDHGAGAVWHDRAHKFRQRDHAAFHVKMSVDQARGQKCAGQIDNFLRFVITQADHAAIIYRDIRFVNLATQHIDQARILEEQLGRLLPTRDAEFMLKLPH
jgi:hypothetical protein